MAIVAKYSLNGNANDSAGSNNGTATNVNYVAGKSGQAGSFNGSTSTFNLGTSYSFRNGSNEMSVSFIAKNISVATNNRRYFAFNKNSDYFILAKNQDSKFSAQFSSNGTTGVFLEGIQTLLNNVYYYFTITYKANDKMKLYINGVFQNEVSIGNFSFLPYQFGQYIGSSRNDTEKFNGIIDEFEIHNTVLIPAEVKNKYLYYNGFI